MKTFKEILEEGSIPRDPKTDEEIDKGRDWKLFSSKPYGPKGKYQDWYIVFKAGGTRPSFETEKEARSYLKKQGYK